MVDYAIVNQENIHLCHDMNITCATQQLIDAELTGQCDPDHNISDHSLISWSFQTYYINDTIPQPEQVQYYIRYDVSEIGVDFMGDQLTTEQFEALDTHDVNLSYERFCDIVKLNMNNHSPSKRVRIDGCRRSHRHTPKPSLLNYGTVDVLHIIFSVVTVLQINVKVASISRSLSTHLIKL